MTAIKQKIDSPHCEGRLNEFALIIVRAKAMVVVADRFATPGSVPAMVGRNGGNSTAAGN